MVGIVQISHDTLNHNTMHFVHSPPTIFSKQGSTLSEIPKPILFQSNQYGGDSNEFPRDLKYARDILQPHSSPPARLKHQHSPMSKSLLFAVDVLSDSFAGEKRDTTPIENKTRKASIRSLLEMLCSHSQQTVLWALDRQKVLVRNAFAAMMRRTNALVRAKVFLAWAKIKVAVGREKNALLLLQKTVRRYETLEGSFWRTAVFEGWRTRTIEHRAKCARQARTHAFLHQSASAMKEDAFLGWQRLLAESQKRLKNTHRVLETLIGSDRSLALHASFAAWHDRTKHAQRVKASAKKTIATLLGTQDEYLIQSTFREWSNLAKETLQQMKDQGRLLKIFGDQSKRIVYKEAWDTWQEFHLQVQNDKRQAQKVLSLCVGNQSSLVLRTVFQAWLNVVRDELRARMKAEAQEAHDRAIIDAVAAAEAAVKAKAREERVDQLRRTFQKMAGESASVLLSNCFTGWWQPVLQDKKAQKAAAKLLLGNDRMTLSSTVVAWSKVAATMRQTRAAGMQKTAMLMGNEELQGKMLTMQMFGYWRRFLDIAIMEKEQEQFKKEKQESMARSIMMKFADQSSFALSNTFNLWVQLLEDLRKERQNETKMISLMMGAQDKTALSTAFKAWIDFRKSLRHHRKISEQKRFKKATMNSCQRMLIAQITQNQALAVGECFAQWVQDKCTTQMERALAKAEAASLRDNIGANLVTQYGERQFVKTAMACWVLGAMHMGTDRHFGRRTGALRSIQERWYEGTAYLVLTFALTAWYALSYATRESLKCVRLEGENTELKKFKSTAEMKEKSMGGKTSGSRDWEACLDLQTERWNRANGQLIDAVRHCAEDRKQREAAPDTEYGTATWSEMSNKSILDLAELEVASRSVASQCTELAGINARLCPPPTDLSESQRHKFMRSR